MESLSLFGILGFFSLEDIKKKRIMTAPLLAAAIAGLLLHVLFLRISIWNVTGGIAVGAVMYFISVLSGEKIGKGDAMMIAVTGIFLGFWGNIIVLWTAMFFSLIAGAVAVLFFKKGRHYELPFIPFMFISYAMHVAMNTGGVV